MQRFKHGLNIWWFKLVKFEIHEMAVSSYEQGVAIITDYIDSNGFINRRT